MKALWVRASILICALVFGFTMNASPVFAKKSGYGTPGGFGKGEKKGWEGDKPPGWSHGKKKGWKGQGLPPGLAKKAGKS